MPTPRPKFSDLHILLPLLLGVDHEDDISALEKELFSLNPRVTTGYNPMCPQTLYGKKKINFICINLGLSSVKNVDNKPIVLVGLAKIEITDTFKSYYSH